MNQQLQAWAASGDFAQHVATSYRVFFRDIGETTADANDTLLLIHGFPESSFSFHKVVDNLASRFRRIVCVDLVGFGLSDKPGRDYSYSLFAQTDILLWLWQELGIRGGHVIAHDMGDSIATELAVREQQGKLPAGFDAGLRSVTLTNAGLVLSLAVFRWTQTALLSPIGPLLSRLASYRLFHKQIRSAHGNDGLSDEDIKALWDNTCLQQGNRKSHLAIRYQNERKQFEQPRWLPALQTFDKPLHLCWGDADRVCPIIIARHLKENVCPQARLSEVPGAGHFCALSDPAAWTDKILAFYQHEN